MHINDRDKSSILFKSQYMLHTTMILNMGYANFLTKYNISNAYCHDWHDTPSEKQ